MYHIIFFFDIELLAEYNYFFMFRTQVMMFFLCDAWYAGRESGLKRNTIHCMISEKKLLQNASGFALRPLREFHSSAGKGILIKFKISRTEFTNLDRVLIADKSTSSEK
jgi:hypothetical protein